MAISMACQRSQTSSCRCIPEHSGAGPSLNSAAYFAGAGKRMSLGSRWAGADRANRRAAQALLRSGSFPHSAVLPHADLLVTQCGTGTLTKALIHGVPLIVCRFWVISRISRARGGASAGVQISNDAPPEQISAAIQRVLSDQKFRTAARRLGAAMALDGDAVENAVQAIETSSDRFFRYNEANGCSEPPHHAIGARYATREFRDQCPLWR